MRLLEATQRAGGCFHTLNYDHDDFHHHYFHDRDSNHDRDMTVTVTIVMSVARTGRTERDPSSVLTIEKGDWPRLVRQITWSCPWSPKPTWAGHHSSICIQWSLKRGERVILCSRWRHNNITPLIYFCPRFCLCMYAATECHTQISLFFLEASILVFTLTLMLPWLRIPVHACVDSWVAASVRKTHTLKSKRLAQAQQRLGFSAFHFLRLLIPSHMGEPADKHTNT